MPAVNAVAEEPLPPEGAHEYVYGAVPPEATTAAVPVLPPKQSTGVEEVVAVSWVGSVTVVIAVVVQPLASVTVAVYVPAARAVAEEPVPPDGAHAYV